jgi:hypothetical protein
MRYALPSGAGACKHITLNHVSHPTGVAMAWHNNVICLTSLCNKYSSPQRGTVDSTAATLPAVYYCCRLQVQLQVKTQQQQQPQQMLSILLSH